MSGGDGVERSPIEREEMGRIEREAFEQFQRHLEQAERELAEWDRKHLRKKAVCPRRPGGH